MEYMNRIRAARSEVRAVRADMAAEDNRRQTAGEPAVEDARFNELNDRAERASEQLRAALLGREACDRSIRQAREAADRLCQHREAERDSGERSRSEELARWHAADNPTTESGRDATLPELEAGR